MQAREVQPAPVLPPPELRDAHVQPLAGRHEAALDGVRVLRRVHRSLLPFLLLGLGLATYYLLTTHACGGEGRFDPGRIESKESSEAAPPPPRRSCF